MVAGIVGASIAAVGLLVTVVVLLLRLGRWVQRIEDRFDLIDRRLSLIEGRLSAIETPLSILVFIHAREITSLYQNIGPSPSGNPYTREERDELLKKLVDVSLTYGEALRLKEILEEDQQRISEEDFPTYHAIVALLTLVDSILPTLKRKASNAVD